MSAKMRSYRRLWVSLISVITLSFLGLGFFGREIYRQAPPLPQRVLTSDGTILFTGQDIKDGQNVWQSMGRTGQRQKSGGVEEGQQGH
jgi:nitric oxide reductase subunit B